MANNENDEKIQDAVLQSLQPHGNLTGLAILNYGGRIFPSWLLNPLLPKLTTLTLNFCTEPNFLPPFGRLPYLRFLNLSGSTGFRDVGDELSTYSLLAEYGSSKQPKKPSYPSLEVLSLRNMLNLVEWQGYDGDFPYLKELVIENCPNLWKIATIPQEATLEYCPKLKFLTCPTVIKKLKIRECGFCEIMVWSISENLTISNCVELISINWSDGGLNYVEEVTLECCPKLKLQSIPTEIKKLKIAYCDIQEIVLRLVSENLTISNCVELISITLSDGALNFVKEVTFKCCPKLELVTIPIRILKLEIHECGFHEIFFQSVPENLTISNCIELTSINWMDRGVNSVSEVSFEYCPKLELVTIPFETSALIINKCGFREIILQSVPEYLTISNCIELISIKWKDGGLQSVILVTFEYCPKLELITIPVGTLTLIINECGFREIMFQSVSDNLTISNCVELISINWMDGGLNSVRKVSFEYCPKLELVTIPVGALNLKIHKCGFREIMFQSVSENLTISNCLELTSINWMDRGVNSIREVSFEYCPKLELVTILVRTLKLKIYECGFREIMFQSVSKNLSISHCAKLISINWMDRGLNSVRKVSFEYCPKLKLITIPVRTLKLKIYECGFREIMFWSVCENLSIANCVELISINWRDRGLNSIREVIFKYCPKLELQLPVKDALHSMTQGVEIYDCPRMDFCNYVYKRDSRMTEFNLFGNNEICLSCASVNFTIPLLENPFTLFLTKEDFLGVESLTCAPSDGVSRHRVVLNLASLVVLKILRCRKVISMTGLDNLSNLKRLSISYCPELCNWVDKTLPQSLEFLKLDSCDKLSSLPLLSVQNNSNTLNFLSIIKCPRLAVLEGFHGLMNLKTVKLLHCGNISISPATESLQLRPHITIGNCPLMRDWCQRNSITYYELIDNTQDDREAKLESAQQESAKLESGECSIC